MLNVKRIVGNVLTSNMYILSEEGFADCWLVDIGDYEELRKSLPSEAHVKGIC